MAEEAADETPQQENIVYIEIDCRKAIWWNSQVKIGEVMEAVEKEHSEDYTKSVNYLRGQLGVFKIQSDDYKRYIDKSITIRGITIPLIPIKRRERRHNIFYPKREKWLYVTIYDAYDQVE